jgi:hypothetical protein
VRETKPGNRNKPLYWAACRALESGVLDKIEGELLAASLLTQNGGTAMKNMIKIVIAALVAVLLTACGGPSESVEPGAPETPAAQAETGQPTAGAAANKLCTIFTDEELKQVVESVQNSGANAPEMCRIAGPRYVLDITAASGDWSKPDHLLSRFKKAKTSACPQAEKSGSTGEVDGKWVTGTWCKVDGVNYIVEVVALDDAGNSVPTTKAQDTDPLMVKLLERVA